MQFPTVSDAERHYCCPICSNLIRFHSNSLFHPLLDAKQLSNVRVNLPSVVRSVDLLTSALIKRVTDAELLQYTLRALQLTDLTTLAGDDTESNVARLCFRAAYPFSNLAAHARMKGKVHTAAVCVYPSRVADAHRALTALGMVDRIQIASVATGFPSGSYPLETRLQEIRYAVGQGATEIDIVIDRSLVLTGRWQELYDEIVAMREACGDKVHLKAILAFGECGTMVNVSVLREQKHEMGSILQNLITNFRFTKPPWWL